jgi:hypothetical protein
VFWTVDHWLTKCTADQGNCFKCDSNSYSLLLLYLIAMGWITVESWSDSWRSTDFFLLRIARTSSWVHLAFSSVIPGAVSLGAKWWGCEADR